MSTYKYLGNGMASDPWMSTAGTEPGKLAYGQVPEICSAWSCKTKTVKMLARSIEPELGNMVASVPKNPSSTSMVIHIAMSFPFQGVQKHVRHPSRTVRNLPSLGKFNITSKESPK